MSDYRTTDSKFAECIDKDLKANYFVPLESIGSPMYFASLEEDGLNAVIADNHVENGYLLNDLRMEFALQDGVMGIKVSADASDYLNEIALNDLSEAERFD